MDATRFLVKKKKLLKLRWHIRTGINQGDTALCTEIDLALALENYGISFWIERVSSNKDKQERKISNESNRGFVAVFLAEDAYPRCDRAKLRLTDSLYRKAESAVKVQ